MKLLATALACLVLLGCASLYQGVTTFTAVVDKGAQHYASAYNSGLVAPDVATRVASAHAAFQKAAGVAHDALVAVKAGGTGDPKPALEAARGAAFTFIDAIFPVVPKAQVTELRAQLQKAGAP